MSDPVPKNPESDLLTELDFEGEILGEELYTLAAAEIRFLRKEVKHRTETCALIAEESLCHCGERWVIAKEILELLND